MKSVAGVDYPCLDCVSRCNEPRKVDLAKKVFKALLHKLPVNCLDYRESCYHGVDGCQA